MDPAEGVTARFAPRGTAGIALIAGSEALLFAGNGFVATYFTPLVWTGYILLVDALNLRYHAHSLIDSRRREFILMIPWSILCWCIFELYNMRLRNWTYAGLPPNLIARSAGYAWSFATILPAVLETNDFIQPWVRRDRDGRSVLPWPAAMASIAAGSLCLILPLVAAEQAAAKMFGLVWIGFFLLLDPVNGALGGTSILAQLRRKEFGLAISLTLSGLVCGILWEFWNYWAGAKWTYAVPLAFAGPKIFEMPLLGYLGFIPFAFECWVMQEFFGILIQSPSAEGRTA